MSNKVLETPCTRCGSPLYHSTIIRISVQFCGRDGSASKYYRSVGPCTYLQYASSEATFEPR